MNALLAEPVVGCSAHYGFLILFLKDFDNKIYVGVFFFRDGCYHQFATPSKRQVLVEHPFGTMKRQWGFDYILTKKGIEAASADFSLIAIAYNLKRLLNIKGQSKNLRTLIRSLKTLLIPVKKARKSILRLFSPKCIQYLKGNFFLQSKTEICIFT